MEYMKIEGFLGGAFSRIINKAVETKTGFRPEIDIQSLNLSTTTMYMENVTTGEQSKKENSVVLDMRVSMSKEAFEKLIEEATK